MANTTGALCPSQAVVCFLLLTFASSWAVEVTATLVAHGVLRLHVSNGLQTLAQLTPAVAAPMGPQLLPAVWINPPEKGAESPIEAQ